MLTEDDINEIRNMMQALLEGYGMKKPPSAAALRQQRYRERKLASSVTGHNESVTRRPAKRNGASQKRNESITESNAPIVIAIPLNDGSEFGVTEPMVKEFEALYPMVDVNQTLREIRGWNFSDPKRRKTRDGIMKHINYWLAKEQNKG